jgi:bifunctional DNA-binding transcriptional regulator/antitoxin component of YhaV-PrlF toxin-antitoxin module
MSISSKLTTKNQTTIPKAVVEALQIKPSSLLLYEIEPGGRVVLSAKSATFADLAETFPVKKPKKAVSLEQIKAAVRQGAARRLTKAQR